MIPIPIRARTDAPITCIGGIQDISPNNPLADTLCPVCEESVDARPTTLVLVGFRPDVRAQGKRWGAGAAVIVHADCAGKKPVPAVDDEYVEPW
jgi:hypothetical protein